MWVTAPIKRERYPDRNQWILWYHPYKISVFWVEELELCYLYAKEPPGWYRFL